MIRFELIWYILLLKINNVESKLRKIKRFYCQNDVFSVEFADKDVSSPEGKIGS